jgi:hypothetical protein
MSSDIAASNAGVCPANGDHAMADFPQSLIDTIKAHDDSEPQAGASDAQIAAAQAAAGFEFPPSYDNID